MNTCLVYGIIFVILLVLELAYFKIADKFNIIDKPNERSSHSSIVLRGGGIIFLLVYGVDGVLTICHRILLHENLGEAHRKHAYQLMANELKMSHVTVSLLYMCMQLVISLGFIYLCPDTVAGHWGFFIGALLALAIAYVLFKKKYYHLHEEYLASLKK